MGITIEDLYLNYSSLLDNLSDFHLLSIEVKLSFFVYLIKGYIVLNALLNNNKFK